MTMTCGSTGVADVGELVYSAPLSAHGGDRLTFAVDGGWHIRWIQEYDHPKDAEGGNTTPGGPVAGGPAEVTIGVPARTGDMIVGLTLWAVSDDEGTVAQLDPSIWVRALP